MWSLFKRKNTDFFAQENRKTRNFYFASVGITFIGSFILFVLLAWSFAHGLSYMWQDVELYGTQMRTVYIYNNTMAIFLLSLGSFFFIFYIIMNIINNLVRFKNNFGVSVIFLSSNILFLSWVAGFLLAFAHEEYNLSSISIILAFLIPSAIMGLTYFLVAFNLIDLNKMWYLFLILFTINIAFLLVMIFGFGLSESTNIIYTVISMIMISISTLFSWYYTIADANLLMGESKLDVFKIAFKNGIILFNNYASLAVLVLRLMLGSKK